MVIPVPTFQEKPSVPSWPLKMIHASSGAHSVSHSMGTWSSLLMVKRSGREADHSPQPTKVKVKQSRYRPGVVQSVPES